MSFKQSSQDFNSDSQKLQELLMSYVGSQDLNISLSYNRRIKDDIALNQQLDFYQHDWVNQKEKDLAIEKNQIWQLSVMDNHNPDNSFKRYSYYLASLFYPDYSVSGLSLKMSYALEKNLKYLLKNPEASLAFHYGQFKNRVSLGIPLNCDFVNENRFKANDYCFMLSWNPQTQKRLEHNVGAHLKDCVIDGIEQSILDSSYFYFERGLNESLKKFLSSYRVKNLTQPYQKKMFSQAINIAGRNKDKALLDYLLIEHEDSKNNPYFINLALKTLLVYFIPNKTEKLIHHLLDSPDIGHYVDLYHEDNAILKNCSYGFYKNERIHFLLYDLNFKVTSQLLQQLKNNSSTDFIADMVEKRNFYLHIQENLSSDEKKSSVLKI